ncbi:very-long-chain 3-oxoacyl-CoA reductase-like protein At1g24470 [Chenopodium quinoa]|uniref:Uncharacterized protein n=1 Tax=Chenopodium quinoa TaxID=63459 RepID=A0A803M6X1_CHEQI|nr:very-long-chain 3-oxoacyl-CoA reductase-like protein At1g24470 [Chenopodium quinoa]
MLQACNDLLLTQPLCISLLSFLGILSIFKHTLCLLKWTYISFLRPPKDLKKTYGSWALITGSSDGIGRAFAFELAAHGLNLILVSRSATKLEHVACDIKHKFPNINIKMVAIDFSRDISYVTKEVKSVVKGLDVGVLVNNVGITYPKAMYVHEIDEDTWMKILRVNVGSINGVTKAILPNMLQKRKGAIINIGSGASIVVPSHPLYAIYAATKGYIDQLSRSLHVEYKSQGVDVQCQLPLYVATKMAFNVASVERPTLFIPTAEDYAVAAVRRIGYEARCTPFWAHSLQWYMASYLPNSWLDAWRLSIGIRRRSA